MENVHKFIFNGNHFILDVNSGAIHFVDKITYDLIDEDKLQDREKIIEKYKSIYDEKEINECYDEILELVENGILYSNDSYVDIAKHQSKSSSYIKAVCLNVAHDCNLRCKYCFADGEGYNLEKKLMSFQVAKKSIDFLIKESGSKRNLEVDFFGGEPLLNFDVVKKTVEYARTQEKLYNKNFRFTITTNGTLLTDEIIDYLEENMENIVLSIDGRKEIHDNIRVFMNDKGSYDIILPNIKKVVAKRHLSKKQYFIRGTFTSKNLDFSEDVKHFIDLGFKEISIEPVALPYENPLSIKEKDFEQIFNQYEKICEELIKNKDVNFYHFNIDIYNGPCIYKRLIACGAGYEYVAITPNGDVYPCHQFIGNKDFIMGNIFDDNLNTEITKTFKGTHIYNKLECKECWARFDCSGGCKANSYNFNGDIMKPYEINCKMQKKRIECAIALQYYRNSIDRGEVE